VADIFLGKNSGCWKMHAVQRITLKKIDMWGAEQGRMNNPFGLEQT